MASRRHPPRRVSLAPTALLTWAGSVGAISGFSEHGFVLENNDGSSYGDPNRSFLTRTPLMVQLPQVLLDQTSLAGLDAAMCSYRGPCPVIWNLATPKGATSTRRPLAR